MPCPVRRRAKLSLVLSLRRGRLSASEAGEVSLHALSTTARNLPCPLPTERTAERSEAGEVFLHALSADAETYPLSSPHGEDG